MSEATRKDYQISRRLFHMGAGLVVVFAYWNLFSHAQVVHLLGMVACVAYVFDRFRVAYPDVSAKFQWLTNFFLRAEETLKESAMIPYAIGILLTILSFPKTIALLAISILAVADPLSALVGIRFGKNHWVKEKSVEGSLAFFTVSLLSGLTIFFSFASGTWWQLILLSLFTALAISAFEMLPIKVDDNLTIPLFVGFVAWGLSALIGVGI